MSKKKSPGLGANSVGISFVVSGAAHMVKPELFKPIMPRFIPTKWHKPLIYLSGLAELICAWGIFRKTKWGAIASAAILVAVFPANVQMALDSGTGRNFSVADNKVLAWVRLPLQIPMIRAVLKNLRNAD